MKQPFLERIKSTPLIFDGAMGTVLYEKGIFLNTCYDELNLINPDLIRNIHQGYVDAGADVILTNTFGANRIKLEKFGLADKVVEINQAGVRLAKEVNVDGYVLASVGSNLRSGEILTSENINKIKESYKEQISVLAESEIDGIIFETFFDLEELILAANIAKEYNLVVVASMTLNKELETPKGLDIVFALEKLDKSADIDVLGLNCSIGPHAMLSAVEKVINKITKPLVVQPNAGHPQKLDGRMIYLSTPEYFTSYCKNYINLGVMGVGGCCGTNAEHIKEMSRTIKALTGVKKHVEISKIELKHDSDIVVTPTIEKSSFAKKLFSKNDRVVSIEITPPRSIDLTPMLEKVKKCKDFGVDAINIPDGPRASARISPMVAAVMIEQKIGIEVILHYCCRDRNLIGMQSDLLGGFAAGIKNYLVVTGDPPKLGNYPEATAVFDVDAVGLTKVIHNLNYGQDIAGNEITPPTSILIGIGANPCAVNLDKEIQHFYNKIDAGAEYVMTQPVFDADMLLRFIDKTSNYKKTIPVVAGIWPLVSLKNALFLKNEVPGVEIPDNIIDRMTK
ncbi:MAG: bifunctional homocysteine S-methyltransferase/methylenetetrahydrofolate reductase, partial [Candidatus Gastranaerophilaceae bacterium]